MANNALNRDQVNAAKSNIQRHMDRFDIEAEAEANAISRRNGMTPRKVGQQKSGFGRTAYHPNRLGYGESQPRRFYASLSR